MKLLVVNTGSASVKLSLFDADQDSLKAVRKHRFLPDEDTPEQLLKRFIDSDIPDAVVHRVVHGGAELTCTILIDAEVEKKIQQLTRLAPLHNPVALRWIQACRTIFNSNLYQAAVFDTAFYARLPQVATAYALPYDLTEQHAIRRYGFHGIAHRAMWQRWRQLRPDLADGGRLITIQLGGGCSITATDNGLPQDTSMGFSPLEGLVMATRCGDIDPGIISYLMRQLGMSADDIDNVLNEKSGLMGLSGQSENIVDLIHNRDQRSRLAVDLYCYRVRKYLGAFQMILGGVDGIVFGGGVGEHVPEVREKVLNGMSWCGIELSKESNQQAIGREAQISHANSAVDVRVIPVDEASLLAQEAVAVLKQHII